MTALYCITGGHIWHRDAQIGRPPKNCPEHQPVKEEIKVISSSFKKDDTPVVRSVVDMVPGLADLLKENEFETLICEIDQHEWQRKRVVGKKPRFCPEHSPVGQVVRRVERIEVNREEQTAALLARISAHAERVRAAEGTDNIAYQSYMQNKDNTESFNNWLRMNTTLLNEVTALRTQETNLERIYL